MWWKRNNSLSHFSLLQGQKTDAPERMFMTPEGTSAVRRTIFWRLFSVSSNHSSSPPTKWLLNVSICSKSCHANSREENQVQTPDPTHNKCIGIVMCQSQENLGNGALSRESLSISAYSHNSRTLSASDTSEDLRHCQGDTALGWPLG